MSLRFSLTSVLALVLFGLATANDNVKKQTDHNIELSVGLYSHERNEKVSGTKVECVFQMGSVAIADPVGEVWDTVTITSLRVECDDMDKLFTPSGSTGPTFSKTIRIASTHFDHDEEITFQLTATFHCTDSVLGTQDIPVTHTAKIKAFNKGMTYEHGEFAGLGNQSGGTAAKVSLENMNHVVSWDERNSTWTKTLFLNDLALVTALHAGSHGIADGIYDNFNTLIVASDIYSSRSSAATNGVLPLNLAFIDACDVGVNTTWLQNLLLPYSSGILDRAAMGFTITVNSYFSPDYGDKFWDAMKDKKTIGQARVDVINEYNRLVEESGEEEWTLLTTANTPIVGDVKTRLYGVYTGDQTLPNPDWYKVL